MNFYKKMLALFLCVTAGTAQPVRDDEMVSVDWCSATRYCDDGYHCCNAHTCCPVDRLCCNGGSYCCHNLTNSSSIGIAIGAVMSVPTNYIDGYD